MLGRLLCCAIATAFLTGCQGPTKRPPNVLLVSIDSLRADHVGAYGYERETTPTLDRLAANGVLFDNAISSSSWTLPAHAALLTGLPDSAHGAVRPRDRLSLTAFTLAEAFSAADYHTVGFFSGPFLDPSFGFGQGFDLYVDCTSYGIDRSTRRARQPAHQASHLDRTNPTLLWNVLYRLRHESNKPFFYFIHMWDVHYDLIPPEPFRTMFDGHYRGTYDGSNYRHDPAFRKGMDPADHAHVLALYDGEVRYTDETLGQILSAARARGLLDNTLVVVTSDHGDEFLDHGDKGHRNTLYQELIHVPLILWWPDKLASQRLEQSVRLIDVAPTVLELAGLAVAPTMQGQSLLPMIKGKARGDRPALSELTEGRRGTLRSIVLGKEKLVVNLTTKQTQFFDLEKDPAEKRPIVEEASGGRAPRLEKLLAQETARARRHGARSSEAAITSPELQSRLRALGYLE